MNERQLTIRIDNRDRALSEYLADAQQQIDPKVHFDKQVYALEWAGSSRTSSARRRV
jgi:cobalt-zinc-cadmium resistance protein CzcA